MRLTPEEKRLYGQLFHIADSEKLGVITGQLAVEFFKKSRLTPSTLAEVDIRTNRTLLTCRSGQSQMPTIRDFSLKKHGQ